MDEDTFNFLVQKAVEEGYDVSKLKKTTQSDCPPEGDEIPKDGKGIWWIKSLLGKQFNFDDDDDDDDGG